MTRTKEIAEQSIQIINPPVITENQYLPPKQSANVLFNFMDKLDYLKQVLYQKALIPRYYEEDLNYLGIAQIKKIAFPMKCFCDIHLNKLDEHMNFYGYYGIGINKEWGIQKGIQPIHYVNNESNLIKDFSYVFNLALSISDESNDTLDKYNNYLLIHLLFMKPVSGCMYRNGSYKTKNFHDEREWRFVPNFNNIDTELSLTISQELLNPHTTALYSTGVSRIPELWLKLEYQYIKYLVVKNQTDKNELISFILKDIDGTEVDKYDLISKILVFDHLKEDW